MSILELVGGYLDEFAVPLSIGLGDGQPTFAMHWRCRASRSCWNQIPTPQQGFW